MELQNTSNFEFPERTQVITQDRIGEIVSKILIHTSRIELCKQYSKEWDVSYRMIDWYIQQAKEYIHAYTVPPTPQLIMERIQQYEELYKIALKDKQHAVAKSCLKDISELQGLLIQKVDVTLTSYVATFPTLNKDEEIEDGN